MSVQYDIDEVRQAALDSLEEAIRMAGYARGSEAAEAYASIAAGYGRIYAADVERAKR